MNDLLTVRQLNPTSQTSEYHSHYLQAVLSSKIARSHNALITDQLEWQIPVIHFNTPKETRVSMTLNGMRMITEFFANDSRRVLVLVEQRLQADQNDVVHDLLVYLWERVLLMREKAKEAKNLQAESLSAYLGLDSHSVRLLFEESLCAEFIIKGIQSQTAAGRVQRELDIFPLVENLLLRLDAELKEFQHNEQRISILIDGITSQLYHLTSHKQ